MRRRVERIQSNPDLWQPFPEVPAATALQQLFQRDAMRYPILVAVGPSRSRKTEWAKSRFRNALELKIGTLGEFPDAMRGFDRREHDGLVLDDIRDAAFLVRHQEKIQGKYNSIIEFAETPGGTCVYSKDMWAVPIIATMNHSTANLHLFQTDDFLSNPENRVLLTWPVT